MRFDRPYLHPRRWAAEQIRWVRLRYTRFRRVAAPPAAIVVTIITAIVVVVVVVVEG